MLEVWMIARCVECTSRTDDMMKVEGKKRAGLTAGGSVFRSKALVSVPNRTKAQVLANTWPLASCMQNHLQSTKTANISLIVVNTLEPAVYIPTIILF